MKSLLKKIVVLIITWEAKLVLKKYQPKIIAVTGSVGKTGTKDAIYTVVSHFLSARKSKKSFNSEIGIPLTILNRPTGWSNPLVWLATIIEGLALIVLPNNYPKWLVLEMGADKPGDISDITSWLKPDIAVVTRLAKIPVHIEFFGTAEAVYREKSELVKAVKRDGVAILNADDEDVLDFRSVVEANQILYGTKAPAEVVGSQFKIHTSKKGGIVKPLGVKFKVSVDDKSIPIEIEGCLGVQQMYPALAAISVAKAIGLSVEEAADVLKDHEAPLGRMKIIEGLKNTTIIDDSYNSSPVALKEALETLKKIPASGRKIAALGDMLELGRYSPEEHKKAGEYAGKIADVLVTVGIRARGIAEGALNAGMPENNIFQFEDSRLAGKHIEIMLAPGDIVLAKGSQSGIRMEKTVEEIMAHPEDAPDVLVRQDDEWKTR